MSDTPTLLHAGGSKDGFAAVEAIRAKLLDGLAQVEPFAEAIDKTPRTVFGYIAQGMPTTYIGRTPYVQIDAASAWLRSRRSTEKGVPRRGRPRKSA
jgi:hypothetical protein